MNCFYLPVDGKGTDGRPGRPRAMAAVGGGCSDAPGRHSTAAQQERQAKAVGDFQLPVDRSQVRLDGGLADLEAARDVPIVPSGADEDGDLALAWREQIEGRDGGRRRGGL